MYDCIINTAKLHRMNCYYFDAMLRLIIILWLLKWLYAWNNSLGGFYYE